MAEKSIKNDLELIAGSNNSIFTGTEDAFNNYLDIYTNGYSFIYWLSLPEWFDKDPDLKYFKQMTQMNFKSFNGVDDINLNFGTQQVGFGGHEINTVTGIQRSNTEFQIGHKEYSGSVMRRLYQKWISYVRDPRTNIAVYPKKFDCEYGDRNHTGVLLYCVVRPDVTNTSKNIIEYACIYSKVMPTNIPLSNLYNYSIGNQDNPDIEISFHGVPEMGDDVEEFAQKILATKIIDKEVNGRFVGTIGDNDLDKRNEIQWDNILGEIYGTDGQE